MEKVKAVIPESMHGILGLDGKGGWNCWWFSTRNRFRRNRNRRKEYQTFLKNNQSLASLLPENAKDLLKILGISFVSGMTLKNFFLVLRKREKWIAPFYTSKNSGCAIWNYSTFLNPLVLLGISRAWSLCQ